MAESNTANVNIFRIVTSVFLAILVGVLLWFAAPTGDTAVSANNEGVVFNNNKQYEKAVEAFDRAIEMDPEFAMAYNNRGIVYGMKEEYYRAIDDFDKAIELDPGLAIAYYNRSYANKFLSRNILAIADLEKCIQLSDDPKLVESARQLLDELR